MEKKTIVPAISIALLSCIALMLTVIGGLYTYNTFVADAEPVAAQSSGQDAGPDWTVTPVTIGGDTQYTVIVQRVENPYESGKETLQMAVYELRQRGTATCELYFIGARTLAYDFKFPYISDEKTNKKGYHPAELKLTAEKLAQERNK